MNVSTPSPGSSSANGNGTFPLRYVYFYLTGACNLHCRHCWISPRFQQQGPDMQGLALELLISVVEQARPMGLVGVKLTGGEPLIHHRIMDILNYLREKELSVQIETNGVLCTRELARAIAACQSPFVAVSLDGAEAEAHDWIRRMDGCFRKTLCGIENLVAEGIRPQIIMTVVERNKGQMEALVRLAESLGADSVKFNVVQPTGRGERLHGSSETIPIQEMVALGKYVENDLAAASKIPVHYGHPLAFRPMSRMFGENGDGCGRCMILNIMGVLSDGSYSICGIGEVAPELVFGHAAKDRLEDVWNGNPTIKSLREGLPARMQGVCASCVMRFLCLGGCVAQNFYRSGSFWTPHWFCAHAEQAGLFPATRFLPIVTQHHLC